jgi:hypothetical protein
VCMWLYCLLGLLFATPQLHSYNVTNAINTTNTTNAVILTPTVALSSAAAIIEHGILGLKSLQQQYTFCNL